VPASKTLVSVRWILCMLAATGSTHSERMEKCFEWSKMHYSRVMRSGNAQFRGVPGVGSYVNNEWRLVKIGH
jgi:hypothetical protein